MSQNPVPTVDTAEACASHAPEYPDHSQPASGIQARFSIPQGMRRKSAQATLGRTGDPAENNSTSAHQLDREQETSLMNDPFNPADQNPPLPSSAMKYFSSGLDRSGDLTECRRWSRTRHRGIVSRHRWNSAWMFPAEPPILHLDLLPARG